MIIEVHLPNDLVERGWSRDPVDVCWLSRCDGVGFRLRLENWYEIVLCEPHIRELESTASGGYSQAQFPSGRRVPRDMDVEHPRFKEYWWPWRIWEKE